MKIKTDHVTNSSSASFIIDKEKLTDLQLYLLKNHVEFVKSYHPSALEYVELFGASVETIAQSGWTITEEDEYIEGYTSMDNFDMKWFLREIGVDEDDIEYIDH